MGYESKLYIAEKTSIKGENGKTYAQVIAMFKMGKIGDLTNVFEQETDCYFYADDGNTEVLEDCYGDALREATLEDVIYALEEAIDNGENYRRLFPLLSALHTFYEQQKNGVWSKDIVVLHYGY